MNLDELMNKYNCQNLNFFDIDLRDEKLFSILQDLIPKKTIDYFCELASLVDLAYSIADNITNSKDFISAKSANEIIGFRRREEKLKQSYDKIAKAYSQLENGEISINQFRFVINDANGVIKTLYGNLNSRQYVDLYYDKVNELNIVIDEYRFVALEIKKRLESLKNLNFNSITFSHRHSKHLNGVNKLLSNQQLTNINIEQLLNDFFKSYVAVINILIFNILNTANQVNVLYKNRELVDSENYVSFRGIIFDLKEIAKKIQMINLDNQKGILSYLDMLEYIKNVLNAYIYSQQIEDLTKERIDLIKTFDDTYSDKNVINLNSIRESIHNNVYYNNVKVFKR